MMLWVSYFIVTAGLFMVLNYGISLPLVLRNVTFNRIKLWEGYSNCITVPILGYLDNFSTSAIYHVNYISNLWGSFITCYTMMKNIVSYIAKLAYSCATYPIGRNMAYLHYQYNVNFTDSMSKMCIFCPSIFYFK